MSITVLALHPDVNVEMLGLIPTFLDNEDERPAREQFDANYAHGGGWHPLPGFTMTKNGGLKYPGDPVLKPIAMMVLHGSERILIYEHAIVCIMQENGDFEAARMD